MAGFLLIRQKSYFIILCMQVPERRRGSVKYVIKDIITYSSAGKEPPD
jgi:hypothetical protein